MFTEKLSPKTPLFVTFLLILQRFYNILTKVYCKIMGINGKKWWSLSRGEAGGLLVVTMAIALLTAALVFARSRRAEPLSAAERAHVEAFDRAIDSVELVETRKAAKADSTARQRHKRDKRPATAKAKAKPNRSNADSKRPAPGNNLEKMTNFKDNHNE